MQEASAKTTEAQAPKEWTYRVTERDWVPGSTGYPNKTPAWGPHPRAANQNTTAPPALKHWHLGTDWTPSPPPPKATQSAATAQAQGPQSTPNNNNTHRSLLGKALAKLYNVYGIT